MQEDLAGRWPRYHGPMKPASPSRVPRPALPRPALPPNKPSAKPATKPLVSAPATGQRLAKRVAQIKACSRREAEQTIEGGWVRVNGQVVEEPQFRVSDDLPDHKIDIAPQASLMDLQAVTLLLHKPPGFVAMAALGEANRQNRPAAQLLVAASHVQNDPSGTRVLKRHFSKLVPCVPLETGAGGLVVFTQDWRVERKLTEQVGVMEQELIVEVRHEGQAGVSAEVPADVLHRLNQINQIKSADGHPLPPFKASLNSSSDKSSKLRFAVKGGQPGLIALLCDRVGLEILGMTRIRVGRVSLAQLPVGQWRYLAEHERF